MTGSEIAKYVAGALGKKTYEGSGGSCVLVRSRPRYPVLMVTTLRFRWIGNVNLESLRPGTRIGSALDNLHGEILQWRLDEVTTERKSDGTIAAVVAVATVQHRVGIDETGG